MFNFNPEGSEALIGEPTVNTPLELSDLLNNASPFLEMTSDGLALSPASDETLVLQGTKDFDSLIGKEGDDRLYGLAGNDSLSGKEGDDIINGGTDQDWLVGAKGNDVLIDGDGGDLMSGGEGADVFWINNWDIPETPSTILDFQVGTDTIKIGQLGVTFDSLTFEQTEGETLPFEQIQGETTIYSQGKPLAVLSSVDKDSLTPESFIFGDAALANQLQTSLEESITSSETPGATQAIVTPDGFTWKGAAGVSNLEAQTPMQPDDIFSVASTTKAFTGATVLKVVESGKISLDDTLGQRLPEIAKNISGGEDITLRELLNGSSGIPSFNFTTEFFADFQADTFPDKSQEEIVAYVYGEPLFSGLQSTPNWSYTNTGDIIASLMVEQATGQSFAEVMQENVIEPLGLNDTFYGITEQIPENLARSYADIFDTSGNFDEMDGVVDDITEFDVRNLSAFGASGALFSNAQDVTRFTQAIFGGELLSENSRDELVNFVDTGLSDGSLYGLGVFELPDEVSLLGRQWKLLGDSFGYSSETRYLPDKGGYINTVLANRQYPSGNPVQNSATPILVSSNKVLFD